MQFGSTALTSDGAIGGWAELMADALEADGDLGGADAVLGVAAQHEPSPAVTLRIADRALRRGDAVAALRALIPCWESGSTVPQVSSTLALSALALRLPEVTLSLIDRSGGQVEEGLLRWLAGVERGEIQSLDDLGARPAEIAWTLRGLLGRLLACGRDDLVAAAHRAARETPPLDQLTAALGVAHVEAPPRAPSAPPHDRRARCLANWDGPAPELVYGWAWSAAREVLTGERTVLVGSAAAVARPLLDHARAVQICTRPGGGGEVLAEPERLPLAPGRFAHALCGFWLCETLDLVGPLRAIWGALEHEGLLQVIEPGPAACRPGWAVRPLEHLTEACRRAGFVVEAGLARGADGTPTIGMSAALHVVRAVKRVV